MNATTVTSARDIQRLSVANALAIVQAELAAAMALLRDLDVADWQRPTDCTGWNVHDVVAHMVGQNEEMAGPDRLVRRVRQARRHSGVGVLDAHNQCQVRDRANVSNEQLVFEFERWGNRAIRAARRIPAPLRRRMRLSTFFPEARHQPEDSFDFLVRVLMARDAWMHRCDIAAATGRPFTLDQHDGDVSGRSDATSLLPGLGHRQSSTSPARPAGVGQSATKRRSPPYVSTLSATCV